MFSHWYILYITSISPCCQAHYWHYYSDPIIFLLAFCKLIWLHSTYIKSQCSFVILIFRLIYSVARLHISATPLVTQSPIQWGSCPNSYHLQVFWSAVTSHWSLFCIDKSEMKIMNIMTFKYCKCIHPFSSLPHSCCWIIPHLSYLFSILTPFFTLVQKPFKERYDLTTL